MSNRWIILSPAGIRPVDTPATVRPEKPHKRGTIRIGMLSNRKPNTVAWQRWIAEKLRDDRPDLEFIFYEKANPAVGAGPDLLDRITEECSLVITGSGD